MKEKILITGANGMLAGKLKDFIDTRKYNVCFLSSNKKKLSKNIFYWDYKKGFIDERAIYKTDHIIHLAGLNISNRWTSENKKEMLNSRVKTSSLILKACQSSNTKPKTFISASAMGYYGFNQQGMKNENSSPTEDWMSKLCVQWEKAADKFKNIDTRVVKLRLSLILDEKSEILNKTCLSFKFGFGIIFGTGKQLFPWIHIKDAIKSILFSLENNQINGAINIASPHEINHEDYIKKIKELKYNNAILIKVPKKIIEFFLPEKNNLIFNNISLSISKLKKYGFKWEYPEIGGGLKNLLSHK